MVCFLERDWDATLRVNIDEMSVRQIFSLVGFVEEDISDTIGTSNNDDTSSSTYENAMNIKKDRRSMDGGKVGWAKFVHTSVTG